MNLLDSQLKNNSLSNAYIIEGEDLAYNLEYAKEFAKKVFLSHGIRTNLETNPDIEIISKDIIDIGTIRSLIKDMVIRPINNEIKVYIISNAQNLRIEAANAMLKSLEELKAYSLIIFTVDNIGKLLPTIRSRCQIISLNTTNNKFDIDIDRLSQVFAKVFAGDLSAYYKEREFLLSFKEDKTSLMEGLIKILADLINNKYLGEMGKTSYDYNIETLTSINLTRLEKLLEKFELIYRSFRNNINFELSVENIFLNIYREGRQINGCSRDKI
ncbi:DNA polymerase III subunit delta [uncultured Anaerococcus sp.]|uniref:DNA polymerase III subunit delta n=1 Tax=uncultured Anaerococcus sp. TaxID=293428 RepID=UPI00288A47DD|nr:DNA polymerase III subunit delta [uncultured Anaerococcus sp.]